MFVYAPTANVSEMENLLFECIQCEVMIKSIDVSFELNIKLLLLLCGLVWTVGSMQSMCVFVLEYRNAVRQKFIANIIIIALMNVFVLWNENDASNDFFPFFISKAFRSTNAFKLITMHNAHTTHTLSFTLPSRMCALVLPPDKLETYR